MGLCILSSIAEVKILKYEVYSINSLRKYKNSDMVIHIFPLFFVLFSL